MHLINALLLVVLTAASLIVAHSNAELDQRAAKCRQDKCQKTLSSANPSTYASKLCRSILNGPVSSTTKLVTVRSGTVTRKNTLVRTILVTKTALETSTQTATKISTIATDADETSTRVETITTTPKTTITLDTVTDVTTQTSTTRKDVTDTQETTDLQSSTTTVTDRSTVTKTSTRTTTETIVKDELETRYTTVSTTVTPTVHATVTTTEDEDLTSTVQIETTRTDTRTRTFTSAPTFTTITTTIRTTSTLPEKRKRQASASTPYSSFTSAARSVCGPSRPSMLSACSCYTFTVTSTTQVPETTRVTTETTSTVIPTTSTDTSIVTSTTFTTLSNIRTLYTTRTETQNAPESTITESPTEHRTTTKYVDSTNVETVYTTVLSTRTVVLTETVTDTLQTTQTDSETTSRTNTVFTTSEVVLTMSEPTTISTTEVETRTHTVYITTTQQVIEDAITSTTVLGPTSTRTESTTTTVVSSPTSLIQNSGFENPDGLSPWQGTGTSGQAYMIRSTAGNVYAGMASAKFVRYGAGTSTSPDATGLFLASGLMPNTKGRLYVMNIALRLEYSGCRVYWSNFAESSSYLFQWGNSYIGTPFTGTPFTASQWTIITASYVGTGAPMQGQIGFFCPAGSPQGELGGVDDVIVLSPSKTVYDANTPRTGNNVVMYPNFEQGTGTPWRVNNYQNAPVSIESPSYNGASTGLKFTMNSGGYVDISQTIQLEKGKVYLLSFAYKNDLATNYAVSQIYMLFTSNSNHGSDVSFPVLSGASFPAPGVWGRYSEPFAAPLTGNTFMRITWFNNAATQQTGHFSNITVVPIS